MFRFKRQTNATTGGPIADNARPKPSATRIGNQARLRQLSTLPLQAKLEVGAVDDPLEHEADRLADHMMRMPEPSHGTAATQLSRKCAECEEDARTVQTKPASPVASATVQAPEAVHATLRSAGQPLDRATREFLEPRFGWDFSDVRVHTDALADASARSVNALAYTSGRRIAFRAGYYAPQTSAGKRLLAHELAHVGQQSGLAPVQSDTPGYQTTKGTIQRVPAPPGTAQYDASKMATSAVPDLLATQSGKTWAFPPNSVTVSVNEPTVTHIVWEFYDPLDQMGQGFGTVAGTPKALTDPFPIDLNNFIQPVVQGRYTLRCTGFDAANKPVVYSDRSFFIWTKAPESMQDLAALNAIKAAPATHSLGEVGAADARAMMLEHQASLAAGGAGTVQGNRCGAPAAPGVAQQDCTTYVLAILSDAFNAKGKGADWAKVMAAARKGSGAALKGTEVLKALESVAGWKAVFWSPDPRNPNDSKSEHPAAFNKVNQTGKYYGVDVDNTQSVVDYHRTDPTKEATWTNLDKLKKVPLGVIAARGGTHMTLILNGQVYEVHWDRASTDPNVIEATPLENWVWNSGVIVMPPEDFAQAF